MNSSSTPWSEPGPVANVSEPVKFESSIYVDQAAALLGLAIPPELRSGVISNFEQIHTIAQPVLEFSMAETIEMAATFDL